MVCSGLELGDPDESIVVCYSDLPLNLRRKTRFRIFMLK